MNCEYIENTLNEALSQINNQKDYLDILLLFFERELIEQKYGRIKDISHFKKCRAEMFEMFCDYSCSPIFKKPNISKEYKRAFEVFNSTGRNILLSDLGYVFEDFYNRQIDEKTGKIITSSSRKECGMFFSNKELVRYIIRSILSPNVKLSEKTFVDPSMGAGVFLFELVEQISNKQDININDFIENNIYGVDKNPYVIDLFKISLWIKYPSVDLAKISRHFVCFDSILAPVNGPEESWETHFPEVFGNNNGFDYIVGNPPWGRLKANIRDYNLYYNTLAVDYQGKRMKDALSNQGAGNDWLLYKNEVSKYSYALKNSGNYENQDYEVNGTTTGGDADLYKYFLEQSFNILNKGGMIGYIIPASFYMTEGATGLRHLFLENGIIYGLYGFENKKHIFPIHPSYKFLIMLYKKTGKRGRITKARFDLIDPTCLEENEKGVSYKISDLSMCSGDYWTIPECHSQSELDLLIKIYSVKPIQKLPEIVFRRELDMTLDSDIFVLDEEKKRGRKYYPLYEGRMVTQYNSYSKEYVSGNGRTAIWKKVKTTYARNIKAHYYIDKADIYKRNIFTGYRAAYCDVTGQKNVRTVLATLIPKDTVCGNKVPTIEFANKDIRSALLWIGLANSFVVDWIIRRKMSITLNFFHWRQIPFPWLDLDSDMAIKICAASARIITKKNGIDLSGELEGKTKKQYFEYEHSTEEELRSIVDIAVADYFSLDIYELALILYDFCALDQGVKGITGDLRYGSNRSTSYVTRDKLLIDYICAHNLDMDNVIDIFKGAGLDISKTVACNYQSLRARIAYYNQNSIHAYSD